ncbi:MAG: TIGR03032 family protein [Planctomycetaceae bacterium]|nr:TIGR03032 family protein [Planctomycetaceae bacterium]
MTTSDLPSVPSSSDTPLLEVLASRQFTAWLAEQRVSLAFTTYQTGKLFLAGLQPDGRLSLFERTFNRCLGLWGDGQTLWMTSLYQLWRFENALPPGEAANGFDRVYVPRVGYVIGDLDIHDVAVDADGKVVFVNTLFGCLATISDKHSFVPLWRPPFLSKLAAEDRCHLNGLALENGRPAYVTAVSQSDVADGWRDRRRDGGCVLDVRTNETIASGLSMPHSPRIYRDQLWLLDSGTGSFGRVDRTTGKFEPLTFCPGYLRGLSFVGDYAVVGLSLCRENRTFQGLALDDNLKSHDAEAHCGLCVIDLKSGDLVHWLWLQGVIRELYDVVVLPGVRRPSALGFKTDEIRRTLSVGP